MASPVRVAGEHPLRNYGARFTYCRGFGVGLEWNWRESSPCNVLIARRLSADYTLLKSSISEKRPSSCATRARHCDASRAARVMQFLLELCAHFGSVFRQLREIVRARVAQGSCGDTHGLCALQWFGWAMDVPGCRSSGAALCCARIHQRWWARRLPIAVPCALVIAEPRAAASARRVAR